MRSLRGRTHETVMEEATEWVVRLTLSEPTPEELREFVAWLKRSPLHVEQFLSAESLWEDLADVDRGRRIDLRALAERTAHSNVLELSAREPAEPVAVAAEASRGKRQWLVLAASVVIAVVVGVLWQSMHPSTEYRTDLGEQRTIKLPDGSTITLNTRSRVRVEFTDSARNVQLREGEALFKVAKDPQRPFRVSSERALVQAVGTEFVVRTEATRTAVTVIEGKVAVVRAEDAPKMRVAVAPTMEPAAVQLGVGAQADVEERSITTRQLTDPTVAVAWQSRRLVFQGESLASVVAEFNRYNQLQLVVTDPTLGAERISGVFDVDQPHSLVRVLERSHLIRATTPHGTTLRLDPEEKSSMAR